jgi:hypothetical protein
MIWRRLLVGSDSTVADFTTRFRSRWGGRILTSIASSSTARIGVYQTGSPIFDYSQKEAIFLKGFGTQRDLTNRSAERSSRKKYEDDNESWIDDSLSGRFHGKQSLRNGGRPARFLESPWTYVAGSLVCEEYN